VRTLDEYIDRYESLALERSDDGVLEVRFHTDGGPFVWGAVPHRELAPAFVDIGMDPDNRVVVLTGTGDAFCDQLDEGSYQRASRPFDWSEIRIERMRHLRALVDIEVPTVGIVNGPATNHAELVVLSDVVVASDRATFADHSHGETVPGDGGHLIWPHLLGPNRGRYFLLTEQVLDAQRALDLGVVSEVVPHDRVRQRGLDVAHQLAAKPTSLLRATREALVGPLRALLAGAQLNNGLGIEAMQTMLPGGVLDRAATDRR
jgi:enoyl-CoA hydratase/carnithine racemase